MKKPSEEFRMSFFMIILTTVCISLLATGNAAYNTALAQKEKALRMDILRAFSVPFTEQTFAPEFDRSVRVEQRKKTTYYHYNGKPAQTAIITSGNGLWSVIELYMLVDTEKQVLKELKVLSHGETPGLGGRIEEAWFQDQFKGLDISRGIKVVKEKKGDSGEVDAIAGASRTSSAVMTIVNGALGDLR